jgi:hypothetical protein
VGNPATIRALRDDAFAPEPVRVLEDIVSSPPTHSATCIPLVRATDLFSLPCILQAATRDNPQHVDVYPDLAVSAWRSAPA